MNWLKKLWNWLVRKTSTAPKLAAFESWYDGDCDEQSILNSIQQFKVEHPGQIAAKLARL